MGSTVRDSASTLAPTEPLKGASRAPRPSPATTGPPGRFGNSQTGMPDSHTFRLVNGKLANVHTLSVNLNPDRPSPQADDNGAIIR